MKYLLCIIMALKLVIAENTIQNILINNIKNNNYDSNVINLFIESGTMDGFYMYNQFWEIIDIFTVNFPEYFRPRNKIIGTINNNPIYYFEFGNNLKSENNFILLTALHHAREPLSLTMIIKIIIEKLYEFNSSNNRYANFLILPVINVDTYKEINKYYGTGDFENMKMLRKNMNKNYCGNNVISSGVDINRNYDVYFDINFNLADPDLNGASNNPCDEDYKGPSAFSENETKAIKLLVDRYEGKIIMAFNFHAYGNLWITPFNFDKSSDNIILQKFNFNVFKYYKKVQYFINKHYNVNIGNAYNTIKYVATGEASDYLLYKHNIISFSPELGSTYEGSNKFYPLKNEISSIVNYDYIIINKIINYKRGIIIKAKINYYNSVNRILETNIISDNGNINLVKISLKNKSLENIRKDIPLKSNINLKGYIKDIYANTNNTKKSLAYTILDNNLIIIKNVSIKLFDKLDIYMSLSQDITNLSITYTNENNSTISNDNRFNKYIILLVIITFGLFACLLYYLFKKSKFIIITEKDKSVINK